MVALAGAIALFIFILLISIPIQGTAAGKAFRAPLVLLDKPREYAVSLAPLPTPRATVVETHKLEGWYTEVVGDCISPVHVGTIPLIIPPVLHPQVISPHPLYVE